MPTWKLTKEESKRLADARDAYRRADDDLEDRAKAARVTILAAMRTFHDAIAAALDIDVTEANEAREALVEVLQTIAADYRGEFEEMSEKWQDGDKGTDVKAWIDEFDTIASALETPFAAKDVSDLIPELDYDQEEPEGIDVFSEIPEADIDLDLAEEA